MDFLSRTRCREFDNGLRLYVLPRPGRAFELRCYVRTGSIHEREHLGFGLSHFLEHMSFQGCKGYPGTAIADRVAALGGDVNAFTSFDHTAYRFQLDARHLGEAADMLCAMIRYPELPEKRFAAERDVILRECDRSRDNPGSRIFEELLKQLFVHHPLRYPVIGFREFIAQVDCAMAKRYHDARYTPGRCFLVAAGAVDENLLYDRIAEHLGDWPRGSLAEEQILPETPLRVFKTNEIVLPDALGRLMLGSAGPAFGHEDVPALDLLWGILGMGDSSRLCRKLLLENPLAVELQSFCHPLAGITFAGISASAEPGKLNSLEKSLHQELKKLRTDGISRSEYEQEKTQQYADTLRQLENLNTVADYIGAGVLASGTPALLDHHLERLQNVSLEQVNEVCRNYLAEDRFALILQRPAAVKRRRSAGAENPPPVEYKLANGVRVLHVPDKRLPIVHFSLVLPGSGIFEPAGQRGIAALAAAMLSAGTTEHTENALLAALDRCGAEFESAASRNSLILDGSAPRRSFPAFWKLLKEMLTRSLFAPDKFERERQRLAAQLAARATSPASAALDAASKLLFGKHPYAFQNADPDALLHLTAETAKEYYFSRWHAGQTAWGFGGDCTVEEALAWSRELSAVLPWQDAPCVPVSPPEFPAEEKNLVLTLPRSQAVVVKMFPGVPLGLAEFEDVELLSQAENGLGSTLFKRVREDNALSYSVGMFLHGGFQKGCIAFYAQTRPDAVERVKMLFDEELQRLRTQGLTEAEFSGAREGVLFNLARARENAGELLKTALIDMHYRRPASDGERRIKLLQQLTRKKFNALLARVLAPAPGVEVTVLPDEARKSR